MATSLVLEYASAFQNSLENVGLLVRNVNVKMRKNAMMLQKKCVRRCQMFSIKIVRKHVESVDIPDNKITEKHEMSSKQYKC